MKWVVKKVFFILYFKTQQVRVSILKKINTFLEHFAEINSDEYVSNDYELFHLSNDQGADIGRLFKVFYKFSKEDDIKLIKFANWKDELLENKEKYWGNNTSWLEKIPPVYATMTTSSKSSLISMLQEEFGEPLQVYYVDINGQGGYFACYWLEVIFKTNKGIYLLSFQIHD